MSTELELVPAPADRPLEDPRRLAYRIVGDLVDRHLREHATIDGELRVHLDRIREAMWLAGAGFQDRSSVDPK